LPETPSKPQFAKGGSTAPACPPMAKYGMGYRKGSRKT
jgi:hypothetical protein